MRNMLPHKKWDNKTLWKSKEIRSHQRKHIAMHALMQLKIKFTACTENDTTLDVIYECMFSQNNTENKWKKKLKEKRHDSCENGMYNADEFRGFVKKCM